jgi:hypothetical protein
MSPTSYQLLYPASMVVIYTKIRKKSRIIKL